MGWASELASELIDRSGLPAGPPAGRPASWSGSTLPPEPTDPAELEVWFGQDRSRAWQVEDRIERLVLLVDAMWELLGERAGVTEAELVAKIAEIDGRDGSVDRRRTVAPHACPGCGAAIPNGRSTCQFCGGADPGGASPFDDV